mgnify:CR=1 FL=1
MGDLFAFTGNPFVDGGLWGLMEWLGVKDPADIDIQQLEEVFEEITDLYTTDMWKKLMYSIFPNNKITNPAYSGREKEEYLNYLNNLLQSIDSVENNGSCIACGKRGVVTPADRKDVPLTGSKKLRNFFSCASDGADYCPVCLLAVQFLPLVVYTCGDKVMLVSSHSRKVMRRWARECNSKINAQILLKQYTKGIDEGYSNPRNTLFHIAGDLILSHNVGEFQGENISIRIYNFTNYGQTPDVEIYDLPSPVFRFLVSLKQSGEYSKWLEVVKRGFDRIEDNEEEQFKKHENGVYNNLLNNKSILGYFTDRDRNIYGTWNVLKLYLKEVRGMNEARIELVKKLGDEIAKFIRKKDHIKRLRDLENASQYHSFRNVLRHIIKDRLELGEEKPLFAFDEYIEMVYEGDNANWREVQDLLLFRIYEVLHDWLVNVKEISVEEEELA